MPTTGMVLLMEDWMTVLYTSVLAMYAEARTFFSMRPNIRSHGREEWPDVMNTKSTQCRHSVWTCWSAMRTVSKFLFCHHSCRRRSAG